jgi:DNA repair protein SbcC/Rad50
MFDTILIENFQSWKFCELDLSPGVNLIVGDSGAGKSAIIRALELISTNRPLGLSFVNWSKPKNITAVQIVKNDIPVAIIKGKSLNEYVLDGVTLKETLNRDPPKEVQDFLNLGRLNMHFQHENFFLFNDTPGKVGEFINETVGWDLISKSLKEAESWTKTIQAKKINTESQIHKLEKQIKDLDWSIEASKEIDSIEVSSNRLEQRYQMADKLDKYISKYEAIEQKINKMHPMLKMKEQALGLINDINKLEGNIKIANDLNSLLEKLKAKHQQITDKRKTIDDLRKIISEKANEVPCLLCGRSCKCTS